MNKIELDHIELAYEISKSIYDKKLTKQDGIEKIKKSGMNVGSANIYFQIYQHLIEGQTFTRTINAPSFDYFLGRILKDFGNKTLSSALNALKNHIEYFEKVQNTKMITVRQVYEKYSNMAAIVLTIDIAEEDDAESFPEGKDIYRLHKSKERNKELVRLAKERHFKKDAKLSCQVCGFSFVDNYGEIGHGFIEAHHIFPISQLTEQIKAKIEDLALVCSNCHRMLHRQRPWVTIDTLKAIRQPSE